MLHLRPYDLHASRLFPRPVFSFCFIPPFSVLCAILFLIAFQLLIHIPCSTSVYVFTFHLFSAFVSQHLLWIVFCLCCSSCSFYLSCSLSCCVCICFLVSPAICPCLCIAPSPHLIYISISTASSRRAAQSSLFHNPQSIPSPRPGATRLHFQPQSYTHYIATALNTIASTEENQPHHFEQSTYTISMSATGSDPPPYTHICIRAITQLYISHALRFPTHFTYLSYSKISNKPVDPVQKSRPHKYGETLSVITFTSGRSSDSVKVSLRQVESIQHRKSEPPRLLNSKRNCEFKPPFLPLARDDHPLHSRNVLSLQKRSLGPELRESGIDEGIALIVDKGIAR